MARTKSMRRSRITGILIAATVTLVGARSVGAADGHLHSPMGDQIPASQLPKGIVGSPYILKRTSAPQDRSGDGSGNFRFFCGMSKMAYDDPILYPNQPGKAHLHTFFGNTKVSASSTYASLRTAGNGTCSGGAGNRSAYWIPTLIGPDGKAIKPDYLLVYYKSGYRKVAPTQIHDIPKGLRMIAGNAKAMTPQISEFVGWEECGTTTGYIKNCGVGKKMQMYVIFPQCWDGKHLDSADHKSHMAYPGYGSNYGAGCPKSHPVAIPVLTMTIVWTQPAGDYRKIHLSSDMAGAKPGVSAHADYFEAWDNVTRLTWINHCVREVRDCTRGLGNATQLVDPPGLNV